MVKKYCGAKEPGPNQKLGTAQECIDNRQLRLYGLEKINKNLLKKIKPKEKAIPKKKSPKKKAIPKKKSLKKKSPKKKPIPKKKSPKKDKKKKKKKIINLDEESDDEDEYGEFLTLEQQEEVFDDIMEDMVTIDEKSEENNEFKSAFLGDVKHTYATFKKLYAKHEKGELIDRLELLRLKDDINSIASEAESYGEEDEDASGEGLNMTRKLFGRKDERKDSNKFVTYNSGGKFIDEDMRRQMNSIQVQSLYGGGCFNCGGDFNQAFSDAISSEGGNFFFEKDFDRETAKKPESSILSSIKNIIKIITGNSKDVIPFGSWTYRSQQFPSDVDLISIEEKCCSKEEATKKFVKRIQNIVRKINKTKNVYLGDIKAGIDHVFKIDIGQIIYDNLGKATIINYDPSIIRGFISEWAKLKLITIKEKNEILKLVTNKISIISFEKLYEMLREKWLLRWSSAEILKGVKILPGDRKYTLGEAINDPTMTKIDVWTQVLGRYIEFSNVITLYMVDEKGNYKLLNFDNTDVDIVEALKYEIQKYAFSYKDHKLFKMIKRMWSIARMTGDEEMVFKLTPLMQSDFGRLSQIASELETIMLMLEGIKNPPIASIKKQIESWKYKLANVYDLDINIENINKALDLILDRKMKSEKDKVYTVRVLKQLKTEFTKLSNDKLYNVLQNIGLIPIPTNYLPNPKKGSGIYQTAANIYRNNFCGPKARKLLDGEMHPKCWNFCGPGTRIDLDEVRNTPPYDNIDSVCRTHDIDYYSAKSKPDKQQLIRKADIKMLESLEPFKKESGYNIAKAAISSKIKAEDLLPDLASKLFPNHAGRK
jgi:hypothetical protein